MVFLWFSYGFPMLLYIKDGPDETCIMFEGLKFPLQSEVPGPTRSFRSHTSDGRDEKSPGPRDNFAAFIHQ